MLKVTTEILYNSFPSIVSHLDSEQAKVAAKFAKKLELLAKSMAPVRTGALRGSIESMRESKTSWTVVVGVPYGAYVEYGTSRMAARPFLRKATKKLQREFNADAARAVRISGAWKQNKTARSLPAEAP